jgi:uncharacterized membrane protein YfcA
MSASFLFFLILIGLLSGFMSGIFGVGGGVIMVPFLLLLLGSQQEAQGTSLAVLAVPVTFAAAYNYYQEGHVNWKYALIMAVFFVVGGYLGSKLAVTISESLLKRLFGALMLIVGLRMIFQK